MGGPWFPGGGNVTRSSPAIADPAWTHPDGRRALLHAATLVLPAVATGVLAARVGGLAWAAHAVVGAAACAAMPAIYHEGAHHNLAQNSTLHRLASTAAATLGFVPFGTWRAFHLEHHAKVATSADPEGCRPDWSRWRLLMFPFAQWRFFGLVWWWTFQAVMGGGPDWLRRPAVAAAVRQGAGEAVAAQCALVVVLVAWPTLAPVLVPCMVLGVLVSGATLVPEHYGAPVGSGQDVREITISVDAGPIVRHVMWTSNYHAAHHVAPSVPAHHL